MKERFKAKISKASRGAVSIFLVIILVPMMTVSCLFVDMSRVRLARAMVDSAADLTMNSALTQYDTLLQEYYGLFATSQSIDEFLATLDEYFVKCLRSAGLTQEDAILYSQKVTTAIGSGEDISDLINIIFDSSNFTIQRAAGTSLCNPAFLKAQIVNFMKYRAPINSGLSLISSLKSFKNLSKETELIENRQKYYEAEKAVNTTCQETWVLINKYNELKFIKDEKYIPEMKESLSAHTGYDANKVTGSFSKLYREIINIAYRDIYVSNNKDTGSKLDYTCKADDQNASNHSPVEYKSMQSENNFTWYYWDNKNAYKNYTLTSYDTKSTYKVAKSDGMLRAMLPTEASLQTAIRNAQSALNEFEQEENAFNNTIDIKKHSDITDIRYVYHCVTKGNKYEAAAKKFVDSMQALEYCYRWIPAPELADGCDSLTVNTILVPELSFTTDDLGKDYYLDGKHQSYFSWYQELVKQFKDSNSTFRQYYKYSQDLEKIAKNAKQQYDDSRSKVDTMLGVISERMAGYMGQMDKASELLGQISGKLGSIYSSVTSDEKGSLKRAKGAWNGSVNSISGESTIASQDKAELENIAKQFKPEEIKALKTRVDNIKTNVDKVVIELKKYTFGTKSIAGIKSYEDLRGPLHTAATNSGQLFDPQTGNNGGPHTANTVESQSSQVFACDKGYKNGDSKLLNWVDQQDSNPDLRKNLLSFYTYLYKNFHETGDISKIQDHNNNGVRTEGKDSGNEEESDKKITEAGASEAKAAQKTGKVSEKNIKDIPNRPSKKPDVLGQGDGGTVEPDPEKKLDPANKNNAAEKSKNETKSLFENIGSILSGLGTQARDALFMTEYVIDMLSYDTIEHTGNTASKMEGGKLNLRSLTLNPINKDNNLGYRTEAEYILYGGSNTGNVVAAYATIYAIRLAFNLIFAFSDASLRNTALAIATPLSAATMGIVPAPLIQAGILAALAAAESGIDIADLKAGKKVPLYKNKQTWNCSIENAVGKVVSVAKDIGTDVVKRVGEETIDKGANMLYEWLDKTDEDLKGYGEDKLGELETQMKSTFDSFYNEQISVVMNEMTSLINTKLQDVAADGSILSQEEMVEYVKNNLKSWLQGDSSDGLMKEVRSTAVDFLMSQADTYIKPIVDKMYNISSDANMEDIAKKLSGYVANAISGIKDQVTEKYKSVLDKATDSAKNAVKNGADSLKDSLNSTLDKFSGSSGSEGTNSATGNNSTFFSFTYKDYIRLLLFLKFFASENTAVMRLADVIQANMALAEEGFQLRNAACYVSIDCTVSIKPLFLAVPLIAGTSNVSVDGENGKRTFCYQYHYNQMKGY